MPNPLPTNKDITGAFSKYTPEKLQKQYFKPMKKSDKKKSDTVRITLPPRPDYPTWVCDDCKKTITDGFPIKISGKKLCPFCFAPYTSPFVKEDKKKSDTVRVALPPKPKSGWQPLVTNPTTFDRNNPAAGYPSGLSPHMYDYAVSLFKGTDVYQKLLQDRVNLNVTREVLTHKLKTLQVAMDEAQTRLWDLEEKLPQMTLRLEEKQATIESFDAQRRELSRLTDEHNKLLHTYRTFKADMEKREKEWQSLADRYVNAMNEAEKNRQCLLNHTETQCKEIKQLEAHIFKLNNEKVNSEHLAKQVLKLQDQNVTLMGDNGNLKVELDELKRNGSFVELSARRKQIQELEKEIALLKDTKHHESLQPNPTIIKLQNKINELEKEVAQFKATTTRLLDENTKLSCWESKKGEKGCGICAVCELKTLQQRWLVESCAQREYRKHALKVMDMYVTALNKIINGDAIFASKSKKLAISVLAEVEHYERENKLV